jgi:hypothetical protein
MLLTHPEIQFGRIVFSPFCPRASFHTAWVKGGSGGIAGPRLLFAD